MAYRLRFDFLFPVLFSPGRHLALWRRSGAHQHCAPGVRLTHSRPAAVGHRVAAVASPADDSIPLFKLDVEQRSWGIDSVDGGLCFRNAWNFSFGPKCADRGWRLRWTDKGHSLGSRGGLCREPQSDFSAGHGHDRTFVSGIVHLGGGVFQRIFAGGRKFRRRRSEWNSFIVTRQVWYLPCGRLLDTLRRMVSDRGDLYCGRPGIGPERQMPEPAPNWPENLYPAGDRDPVVLAGL